MEHISASRSASITANLFLKEKEYWLNQLKGELVVSRFPADFPAAGSPRPGESPGGELKRLEYSFDAGLGSQLLRLSGGSDARLYMVLAAGLVVLLHRYTGNSDIVTAAPIEKQENRGNFVNTVLVLRNRLNAGMTFKELLLQVRKTVVDAHHHQNFPFDTLLNHLELPFDRERHRLLDVGVLLENIHCREYLEPVPVNMLFSFMRDDEKLVLCLEYRASLYGESTVRRIISHYCSLLRQGSSRADTPIGQLDMMSREEKEQLLKTFNRVGERQDPGPGESAAAGKEVHRLFREQAAKTPDHTAVVTEEGTVTYDELNRRAGRLAMVLKENGVTEETVVGVMLPPSIDMVAAILAVLKAGGAWLPLDPQAPSNRLISMLKDSRAAILLTDSSGAEAHPYTMLQRLEDKTRHIYLTPPRPRITDLDALPFPDRSLVDYEKYSRYIGQGMVKNSMVLAATRGCPYRCAYCFKILSRQYVYRSAENILQEIQFYYGLGVRRFVVIDDIFNLNIENGMTLFRRIRENNMKLQLLFPSGFRGDILTKEYIDLMIEAGVISFGMALETASPRLQEVIEKRLDIDKFQENVEYICGKYPHVILELFTMHGFPGETEEEALMTLDFIKRFRWIHFPYINILKIYHNTHMEQMALENGISPEAIHRSQGLAFHELPDTLPFDKGFTLNYQEEFLNQYFLCRERLLQVLPYQVNALTEDEMVQKYNSYLPVDIRSFPDLLAAVGIEKDELGDAKFLAEEEVTVPGLNRKLRESYPGVPPAADALRLLLLDLSQYFACEESNMLYDVVEPPLGLMVLMTYLKQRFGAKINGKIAKSRLDFDSYEQLKQLLEDFKPDIIGIRSLTYYKDFFHQAVAMMRHWGVEVPIITGGPYATLDYETLLQDSNIDLAVIGEGETTFAALMEKILENGGKLPDEPVLRTIDGLGFVPGPRGQPRPAAARVLMMDRLTAAPREKQRTGPADNYNRRQDRLAYIIYTSGSTGLPKGVMVEHRNLVNVLAWFGTHYRLDNATHVLQPTSCTFDPSVEQILGTLLHGAVVYIPPRAVLGHPDAFRAYVEKHRIHVINYVPGFLRELLAQGPGLPGLRAVISGGDTLDEALKDCLIKKGYPLYNQYGPTETTIDALCTRCSAGPVTLGRPIANVRCYILDRRKELVPIGVPGYLYIGGAGVSRGYLNNPELTAEKFDRDLDYQDAKKKENYQKFFGGSRGAILQKSPPGRRRQYNTGDLACWLPEGEICFLGRNDRQVKIRGVRIELEEIERRLQRHEAVKEAVVSVGGGGESLCAYVVLHGSRSLSFNPALLKEYLAACLPDAMVPGTYMRLDSLPLTPRGKVDWKALPDPAVAAGRREYAAPADDLEKELARLWAEVLERESGSIGRDTNFFEVGGHSLKATLLAAKIDNSFHSKIPLGDIFRLPTIAAQAGYLREAAPVTVETRRDEKLVLLKQGKQSEKHLFFAHDGSGDVEAYVEFCNHLQNGFNCWGIRAEPGVGLAPRDITLAQAAAGYVGSIKKVQPAGPYYITGWSLGGAVAFEILRQLEASGETAAFFAMIDAYKPGPDFIGSDYEFTLEAELKLVREYLPFPELDKQVNTAPDISRLWSLIADYLETGGIDIQTLRQRIPGYVSEVIPNYDRLSSRQLIHYLNIGRTFDKAWGRYTPRGKIQTPVHFFAAAQSPEKHIDHWHAHCTQPRKYFEIPGDHYSMLRGSNAEAFARIFDKIVESVI